MSVNYNAWSTRSIEYDVENVRRDGDCGSEHSETSSKKKNDICKAGTNSEERVRPRVLHLPIYFPLERPRGPLCGRRKRSREFSGSPRVQMLGGLLLSTVRRGDAPLPFGVVLAEVEFGKGSSGTSLVGLAGVVPM